MPMLADRVDACLAQPDEEPEGGPHQALPSPDVPVLPLLAVLVPIVVVWPIFYSPFSKTVWLAIDRAFLMRLDPRERLE